MTRSDEHIQLRDELNTFLAEAVARVAGMGDAPDLEVARMLVEGRAADAVRDAARRAAEACGYPRSAPATSSHGRRFDAHALHSLGVAALLRAGHEIDIEKLSAQLAGFLAGPPVPIERLVVLDGDLGMTGSIDVDGWRLHKPTSDELNQLAPIPVAAPYASREAWDPLLQFGWHWVLRGLVPEEGARTGLALFPRAMFEDRRPDMPGWQARLMLNLFSPDPVNSVGEYIIEPERRVDGYANIPSTIAANSDGSEGPEIPQLGPLSLGQREGRHLEDFLSTMSQHLKEWHRERRDLSKEDRDQVSRLRRSAMHFLRINRQVALADGPLFPYERIDVIFGYTVALEHLLVDDRGSITRTLSQRAAVLAGGTGEERLRYARLVRDAYSLRSSVAHGGPAQRTEYSDAEIVSDLRTILRRSFLAVIVLGPRFRLRTCDEALLSAAILDRSILEPVRPFLDKIL